MGRYIELLSKDGFTLPAYAAEAAGRPRGAVVVLQEIFGVNSHIRSVVDRFAAAGYVAVAPAMFERVKPGADMGYSEADVKAGIGLKAAVGALPGEGVMPDIQAAIDHAAQASGGKVGIIGFCWGGLLAWQAASRLKGLSAAVAYYGGGITLGLETARKPACRVLAHFGDQDHSIPMEGVAAFTSAHPEVEAHVYAAGHGFNCDQRSAYDEAAATVARQRTLEFFAARLG